MSTVKPTDKVLVNRAGTDHSAPADMSTVQDTDLLLVNRGGVDYKCTFKDWKDSQIVPPNIKTVTISNVAGGKRFTSTAFPVSVVMLTNGTPASTKALRAYATGAFAFEINPQAKTTSVLAGSTTGSFTVSDPADAAEFQVGSSIYLSPVAHGWTADWTMGGSVSSGYNLGYNDQHLVDATTVDALFTDDKRGVPSDHITLSRPNAIHIDGLTIKWRLYDGDPNYPSLSLEYHSTSKNAWVPAKLTKVGQVGSGSRGDINVYQLAINDTIDGIRKIVGGYGSGRIYYIAPTSGSYATVSAVSGSTISYVNGHLFSAGVGSTVYGASYTKAVANTTMYCALNASGAVASLTSVDPGFTAWTPAAGTGVGPYTGHITFPAVFPTGKAPDDDLPAGVTLTVEAKATNAIGSDTGTSNVITPA